MHHCVFPSFSSFFRSDFCRHFKVASSMLIVLMVSAWTTTAFIAYQNEHMANSDDPFALFDKIYDKPWTRLGPYMVGMCVGWFLFKTNCKIRMSRVCKRKRFQHSSQNFTTHLILNYLFFVSIDNADIWLVFGQLLFTLDNLWVV